MALILGPRQRFICTLTNISQPVGTVVNCLGAKALLVYMHDASNAGAITLTPTPSVNGTDAANGIGLTITAGSPIANGAGGAMQIITTTTIPTEIITPHIKITGVSSIVGNALTIDVYPLCEKEHPNLPTGSGLS